MDFVNGLTTMLPGALVALLAMFYGVLAMDILLHAINHFFNAWRRRRFRKTARMSCADYRNLHKGTGK